MILCEEELQPRAAGTRVVQMFCQLSKSSLQLKPGTSNANNVHPQTSHNANANKTLHDLVFFDPSSDQRLALIIRFVRLNKEVQKGEESFPPSLPLGLRASTVGRYADSSRCLPGARSAAVFHHF